MSNVSAEKAGPFNQYLKQSDFEKDLSKSNNDSKSFVKGEMTGRFEMGSTIVLIFEADSKTSLAIREGQKLNLGEPIVNHK
jgi:phosphatidylserine decarboxylase